MGVVLTQNRKESFPFVFCSICCFSYYRVVSRATVRSVVFGHPSFMKSRTCESCSCYEGFFRTISASPHPPSPRICVPPNSTRTQILGGVGESKPEVGGGFAMFVEGFAMSMFVEGLGFFEVARISRVL